MGTTSNDLYNLLTILNLFSRFYALRTEYQKTEKALFQPVNPFCCGSDSVLSPNICSASSAKSLRISFVMETSGLIYLPGEIWRCHIIPQLSLADLGCLDSAALNSVARRNVIDAYIGAEIHKETIVSTEMIEWVIGRQIKTIRVKLIEDVSEQDLLRLVASCPQMVSINTWDIEEDAQAILDSVRLHDDSDATYNVRWLTEESLTTVLLTCTALRNLHIIDMIPSEWFNIFPRIAPLCTQLDFKYFYNNDETNELTKFYLSPSTFTLESSEEVPASVLSAVAMTHFLTLSSVSLEQEGLLPDSLLQLAKHCRSLERFILKVEMPDDCIVEFCRLCPTLEELRLLAVDGYDVETMRQALQLLPGTRLFTVH